MTEDIKNGDIVEVKEEVKSMEQEVMELLNAFMQQELGNKVTQFNMQGLSQILLAVITKER